MIIGDICMLHEDVTIGAYMNQYNYFNLLSSGSVVGF